MRELKVQCDCGQKFKFDVEPVNHQMPYAVNCPVCGRDGTEKANLLLRAQTGVSAAPTSAVPVAYPAPAPMPINPPMATAPAPMAPQSGLRINPVAHAAPASIATAAPAPIRPAQPSANPRREDGWGQPESDFNKIGSYVVLVPAALGAMISARYIPIEIPAMYIWIAVVVGGLAGGIINIMGRGPIWAGMIVGLVMGIGGYGTSYWWLQLHDSTYKVELGLAFAIGAAPGFGLQYLLQRILKKRAEAEA